MGLVSPAAPAVPFVEAAGVWAPEHATVGAAPSLAAPTKKFVPLLQTVFHVVCQKNPKSSSAFQTKKRNILFYIWISIFGSMVDTK